MATATEFDAWPCAMKMKSENCGTNLQHIFFTSNGAAGAMLSTCFATMVCTNSGQRATQSTSQTTAKANAISIAGHCVWQQHSWFGLHAGWGVTTWEYETSVCFILLSLVVARMKCFWRAFTSAKNVRNQFLSELTGRKQSHKMFNSHRATLQSENMFLFLDCDVTVVMVRALVTFAKVKCSENDEEMWPFLWWRCRNGPNLLWAKLTSCTWSWKLKLVVPHTTSSCQECLRYPWRVSRWMNDLLGMRMKMRQNHTKPLLKLHFHLVARFFHFDVCPVASVSFVFDFRKIFQDKIKWPSRHC